MTWHGPTHQKIATPQQNSQQERINKSLTALREAVDDDALFLWTGGKEAQVIADMLLYAVGEPEEQPIPFGIIDTGNHFEEMYTFRSNFCAPNGDRGAATIGPPNGIRDIRVRRHEKLLDEVINNDDDPRGYHGQFNENTELPSENVIEGLPRDPDKWGVTESCGKIKTKPYRDFIQEDGFKTIITGIRGTDPITGSENTVPINQSRSQPATHTRINPLANWSEANVYAYIKQESLSLPNLYTEKGYRHTDAKCCTDDKNTPEYGEGGRDTEKLDRREQLEAMGYV